MCPPFKCLVLSYTTTELMDTFVLLGAGFRYFMCLSTPTNRVERKEGEGRGGKGLWRKRER